MVVFPIRFTKDPEITNILFRNSFVVFEAFPLQKIDTPASSIVQKFTYLENNWYFVNQKRGE